MRALLKRTNQIPKSSATRELLTYKEITLIPESYSVQINDKIQKLIYLQEKVKNRNKKYSGEFIKAQEYYDKNKEEDKEENDNIEDTKTNTMRNQFVGKLEIIDGMGNRTKNIS